MELFRQRNGLCGEVLVVSVWRLVPLLKYAVFLPQLLYPGAVVTKVKFHEVHQCLRGGLPGQAGLLAVHPSQNDLHGIPGICQQIDTGFSFFAQSVHLLRHRNFPKKSESFFPM